MAGEWPTSTVRDVTTRVTKGTTPTTIGGRFVDCGITFVKVESISDAGHIDPAKVSFIDDETNRMLSRSELQVDDVLFTIAGTIGRVALVDASILPANTNQAVAIVRPDSAKIEPRFLYFVLRDVSRIQDAQSRVVQSVQANFSLTELGNTELPLPSRDEQRAIAHILGTLDDKIELNRRMNETLEAIARAIFKSWFVDFDPVRAKASGEAPESICRRLRLTPDLLALFPDRLVDSELGEIPAGWEVGSIADHCCLNAESWTAKTIPEQLHYVDLANTKNGVISEVQLFSSSAAPSRARRVLRSGDTIVGTVRPGNCSFSLIGEGAPQLTGSTGFAVLTPKRPELRELVYFLSTSDENIERLGRLADGAAYPAVRPEVVTAGTCVVPTRDVIDAFHEAIATMINYQMANQISNGTLAAMRDALLPQLLSGDLRAPVEGAA